MQAIKYANFQEQLLQVFLKTSSNLNDVASLTTSRDNLGVEIGVDVQGFFFC